MEYKVTIENRGTKYSYESATFNTEIEALNHILREMKDDLRCGECDEYYYYLNGRRIN